ncbi:efflux RND transporter periplasmic adaptor subunit [Flammeovirga yaeyamensis]|uniref:Efflux RND transporter periplasmic adaptor subunit n=1 Tax=Flammeovirga yaeyamensis TaxID=367791 RepID=A0AAX1N522_9BACT|nr:efflux RND transporter periplasmic adaptor subunit [Flammeovirga yaeyamensis]MBB3700455.1 cobalt-zinc-cadmium efflux system membrane fusion protein [Flammeovirga yaeyamensis]NMF36921.1 efflux RND transporter periplasmic adaptor subunit [Flammeovirga yaeyamensis]QWG02532.1 efflux RND transporter periplasmic adaptor subunit [Flammeovirga yaeyamensis]
MKNIYKIFLPVLSIAFLIGMVMKFGILNAKTQEIDTTSSLNELTESMKKMIKTQKVKSDFMQHITQLTGNVEAVPNQQISVPAIVSGRVTDVVVDLGDQVKKGQVLAKIYSSDMAEIQQEWIEAKANVDRETKEYEVAKSLFDAGLSSTLEIQQAKSELEAANAQLEKVNQKMKLMGNTNSATHIVRAPISGTITEKSISPNMIIKEDHDEALFTVVNLQKVWVKMNVFESDIQYIEMGSDIQASALAYPDRVFTGKVEKISKFIDPETKVMHARVAIPNQEGLLMPNMAMNIQVIQKTNEEVFAVNENAVVFHNNKDFIVKKNGESYSIMEVKVKGSNQFGDTLIEGNLVHGEEVVTEKALLLFNDLIKL